jgi:hypothetical protein
MDRDSGSILNRYIGKTKDDPKRQAGRDLALKKKWGDKKYGLPEPRVKAVAREETELAELSQDTLVSYGQKAREAGGRTKGTAMAVKKILAARGKSTGVKVPASEETE